MQAIFAFAETPELHTMTPKPIIMLAIVSMAVGCVPIPHAERLVPKTSGTVIDGQRHPVAGARVEYLFRGGRVLGETVTDTGGRFTIGPFSQWFYLVYAGSPGVAPFPYTLERPAVLPDVIRVSAHGATAVYLRGSQSEFDKHVSDDMRRQIILPSPRRWTAANMILTLTPDMKDSDSPHVTWHAPSLP